jgi:hypothetical protein
MGCLRLLFFSLLLLFFLSSLVALTAAVHFGPAQNYPVGRGAAGIAVADFNGDGKPDIVVPDVYAGSLSVFIGNGDGTFKSAQNYALIQNSGTPLGTPAVVVADFNGDDKMDIAIVNSSRQSVDVLLGKGDGTFGRGPTLHFADVPFAIVAGDFNADGKTDLAVTSVQSPNYSKPGKVNVFLGNGDGTFVEPPRVTSVGANPQSIATADFDEDGKADVVVTTLDNTAVRRVQVLFGAGDGTFGKIHNLDAGQHPWAVGVGRFTKSRHQGFAVLGDHSGVTVFLGNGNGTFTSWSTQGTTDSTFSLAVADFDRDGIDDVAIGNPPGIVRVMISDGQGHLSRPASVRMGLSAGALSNWRLLAADLNGDHYPDLVSTNVPTTGATKCFIAVALNQH